MTTKYYSDWMTNSQLLAGQKQDLDLRCNMSAKIFFPLVFEGNLFNGLSGKLKIQPIPKCSAGAVAKPDQKPIFPLVT